MTDHETLAAASVAAPALAAVLTTGVPRRWVTPAAITAAAVAGGLACAVAVIALAGAGHPHVDDWVVLDAAGGLLAGVVGLVGVISVLASPSYLGAGQHDGAGVAGGGAGGPGVRRGERTYYAVLFAFWAALAAVPLAGNLGVAWLLIEATTAVSALLVGFSGKPRALEAGWKYLVLTSLGLGVALLGMVLVAAGVPGGGLGALSWHTLATYSAGNQVGMVAYLLLIAGLATKIGWAPVHNWLPDAHSEAPAPVSAMLSAALLPSVLLVAWRCQQGMAPVLGGEATRGVFIAFGLISVAVAVPFLARALAFKRLLAYSSLEHVGIIALGVGFASPLALAGVAVHVVAHAVAKALGFCAVTPLLSHEPQASLRAVSGVGRTQPALGATIALCLGALSGLPPSPLFVSELLIIAGGFQAGHPWAAAVATVLIALAFLGLLHSLLDTTVGTGGPGRTAGPGGAAGPRGLRVASALAVVSAVLLLAIAGASLWLPTSDLVPALMKGIQ